MVTLWVVVVVDVLIVSVCGRDRSRLCDGGKSGVREENRSGQRQRPGTD